jgi:predicted protein tyrosine phosphatase
MRFAIMSREKAKRESYNLKEKTAIISINDMADGVNRFAHSENLIGVCTVFFDDVCDSYEYGYFMTIEDAIKIKDFVDNMWDKIDCLIVHCYAGISRSAGCMSGILQAKGIDDSWIWNDKKYCPNTFVAKKILEAYGINYNNYDKLWEEIMKERDGIL